MKPNYKSKDNVIDLKFIIDYIYLIRVEGIDLYVDRGTHKSLLSTFLEYKSIDTLNGKHMSLSLHFTKDLQSLIIHLNEADGLYKLITLSKCDLIDLLCYIRDFDIKKDTNLKNSFVLLDDHKNTAMMYIKKLILKYSYE